MRIHVLALLVLSPFLTTHILSAVGNATPVPIAFSPQNPPPPKDELLAAAQPDLKKALAIAEKYYNLGLSRMTALEKSHIAMVLKWKPDFTGKSRNASKARDFSAFSAYLTACTELKGIYLPLASAVFALDISNANAAGNLASAIAAYSEDTTGKRLSGTSVELKTAGTYAEDAAALYAYALSLLLSDQPLKASAMPILLNYGNVSIDMGKLETAKLMFDQAIRLSPGYFPAVQGLAAYWLAKGDKIRATKALESATTPTIYKKLKESVENASEKKVPTPQLEDPIDTMESKLRNLAKTETALATDYYEEIDPEGIAQARRFVNNLKQSIHYSAPDYDYLSQFSTLPAFYSGGGSAAYDAFQEQFIGLEEKLASEEKTEEEMDAIEEELEDYLDGSPERDPEKAASKMQKLMNATGASPELLILTLKPGKYANPTDVIAQQYNASLLRKKRMGYEIYFARQFQELQKVIAPAEEDLNRKMTPLEKAMESELDQLSREHDASHNPSDDKCGACIVKTHRIHEKYDVQLNRLAEAGWMDITNFVNARYKQRLKPNLEAMYIECMRHILLISDPEARTKAEENLKAEVESFIYQSWSFVKSAYSIDTHGYPYECDCSDSEVAAASERQRKAFQKSEAEKTAMENKARKAFESGEIPENSPLYKKLDQYSTSFHLLFMDATWHPLKTEVSFSVKLPLGESGIDVGFKRVVEENVRKRVTYGGGIGATIASGDAAKGALSGEASVSLKGQITTDGNYNIITGDVIGTLQASGTAGNIKATGEYEASVMRGCKLSAEVDQIYNEKIISKAVDPLGAFDELSGFRPETPKKVLWKGEYQVTE